MQLVNFVSGDLIVMTGHCTLWRMVDSIGSLTYGDHSEVGRLRRGSIGIFLGAVRSGAPWQGDLFINVFVSGRLGWVCQHYAMVLA